MAEIVEQVDNPYVTEPTMDEVVLALKSSIKGKTSGENSVAIETRG